MVAHWQYVGSYGLPAYVHRTSVVRWGQCQNMLQLVCGLQLFVLLLVHQTAVEKGEVISNLKCPATLYNFQTVIIVIISLIFFVFWLFTHSWWTPLPLLFLFRPTCQPVNVWPPYIMQRLVGIFEDCMATHLHTFGWKSFSTGFQIGKYICIQT